MLGREIFFRPIKLGAKSPPMVLPPLVMCDVQKC